MRGLSGDICAGIMQASDNGPPKLVELRQQCAYDLAPFSRWRGKHPSEPISAEGFALLPMDLAEQSSVLDLAEELEKARQFIETAFGSLDTATIRANELVGPWAGVRNLPPTRAQWERIARVLKRFGVATKPDLFSNPPKTMHDSTIVLFRQPHSSSSAGSVKSGFTGPTLDTIGTLFPVGEEEFSSAGESFEEGFDWYAKAPEALSVDGDESVSSSRTERASGARSENQKVPLSTNKVVLDMDAVNARLASSAELSAMLGALYSDSTGDDMAPAVSSPSSAGPSDQSEQSLWNLDSRLSQLARKLCQREVWQRGELEALCQSLGLLPGGAIEMINDRAIDVLGVPFSEGDDPLEISADAISAINTGHDDGKRPEADDI